jgi:exonuclease III
MNVIKILTWNISWEAMTGQKSPHTGLDGTVCNKGGKNVCLENVLNKIIEVNTLNEIDFILLQEAEINPETLKIKLNRKYNYLSYNELTKTKKEESIIFYNNTKYNILKQIPWGFYPGRPFIIALFQKIDTQQNILITNLHGPHGALKDKKTGNTLPNYLDFFDYYRLGGPDIDYNGKNISKNPRIDLTNLPIIIGGDFNLEIPGPIKIFNQIFSNEGNQLTCCDTKFTGKGMKYRFDHILINDKLTYKKVTYPKVDDKMYSDHIPVYAEINMPSISPVIPPIFPPVNKHRFGFDFDGVIHKSVTIPDLNGQRHPVPKTNLIKNDQIFTKIEQYLTAGHYIEIISSRWDQSIIKPYLLKHSVICNSHASQITVNNSAKGLKKHQIVSALDIIEFYDDSVNVLKDIMEELKKRKITTIILFLVRPELNDFIKINSISQLDNELIKLNINLLCNKSIKYEVDTDYIRLKENINQLLKI